MMFCGKSWLLTIILYVVLGVLILSQHDEVTNKKSGLSLPVVTIRKGPKAVNNHITDLGLTGSDLVRFFKRHLRKIITYDSTYRDLSKVNNIRVSQYYDVIYRYLFLDSPASSEIKIDNNNNKDGKEKSKDKANKISILEKLTRNVTPLPVHSHNDYWRDLPLLEGLIYGATSTEADIWNIEPESENNEANEYKLAVGHTWNYLDTTNRLLDTLYTTPLLTMLDEVNMKTKEDSRLGVFYDHPHTTLYFYLDFKSDDNVLTYKLLMKRYLKPLIEKNYLSYYDMEKDEIVSNPITIIMTGNYPKNITTLLEDLEEDTKRVYTFMEAPLGNLKDMSEEQEIFSIVSSTSFSNLLEKCGSSQWNVVWRGEMSSEEIHCVKNIIIQAQSNGYKTRIWGAPSWPKAVEKTLWRQQIKDLNVNFLNVDDLPAASKF